MKNALRVIPVLTRILLIVCIPMLLPSVNGQSVSRDKYFSAETSYAIKLGSTKSLRQSIPMEPTDSGKLKDRKSNKPRIIPNFGGRRQQITHHPDALPKGADPLYEPWSGRDPLNQILPVVNIEGIDQASSGSLPPDVNGDVGRDFFVEVVNSTLLKVYDKQGGAVSGIFTANTIWSQVQETSAGDPILLYDQEVDRWFLTEFPSNNKVLVGISHTSDPLGSWDAYAFQTPRFPDFPKYGIWADAYYLTTNEFGSNFPIYAINREDILAGADTARIQRLTVPKIGGIFFEVAQPVDWDGLQRPPANSPGLVVKLNDDDWGTTNQDVILLHTIHIDWENKDSSHIEVIPIPTAPFDTDGCQLETTGGFSCIPQPNGQGIDGAEWIITNKAQYRNFGTHESFVMSFMVDVTGDDVAGIRWLEFRKTASEDWHIYQEGTVGSDDGLHRFMPSIGIDGRGNIGLGYSVSGWDKFPSLRYTGRYSTDPLGTMTFEEFEFAAGGGSQNFDRFGDYASMSVDPSDDETFWFAGQYLPENNSWSTRIVAFKAFRDTFDVFPVNLVSPMNDGLLGDQPVQFSILNRGLNTVSGFPAAYQFNHGDWITQEPEFDSLGIDQSVHFLFDSLVHFDAAGVYPIRLVTLLDIDDNKRNDTVTFYITKYAHRDIALEYLVPAGDGLVCGDMTTSDLRATNTGLDTITSLFIEVMAQGAPLDTLHWTGFLPPAGEVILAQPLSNLADGLNTFSTGEVLVNAGPDEVTANHGVEWSLTANPDGEVLILYFTTDYHPQESTWKLFDADSVEIASGGPYGEDLTTYTSEFCLDRDACYTFTVYDTYGDGLWTLSAQGDFEILNEEGEVIAELTVPKFGKQESHEFCLTEVCLFEVQVGVLHESFPGAADGGALATAQNALGTIQYSLDGGATFQSSASFPNLSHGSYTLIAMDGAGCMDTVSFEVFECNLQASITTLPAVGGDVGQIHIAVAGGIRPLLYSLQHGPFIPDSFFLMLEAGDYVVTIRDSLGCEVTDTVTVSTTVSISDLTHDYFLHISPNPGNGVYQVEADLQQDNLFAEYQVVSPDGTPVLFGSLVRYNDTYQGTLSLSAYPPGVYLMVIRQDDALVVHRIIQVE